jgi:hypothetical protein
VDEHASFGVYNIRKHILTKANESVLTSHTNLVELKQLDTRISRGREQSIDHSSPYSGRMQQKLNGLNYSNDLEDNGLNRVS